MEDYENSASGKRSRIISDGIKGTMRFQSIRKGKTKERVELEIRERAKRINNLRNIVKHDES